MTDGSGVAALYPFLYPDASPDAAERAGGSLTGELVRSTVEKVAEAGRLRQEIVAGYGPLLRECAAAVAPRFAGGGRLLAMGNGGSSSDCIAVASLLCEPPWGQPLPALSLTADPGVLTALANDVGFEVVFARQVAAMAKPSDVVLAISTSGNSENLCRALDEAARRDLLTVGLSGHDGGRMAQSASVAFSFVVRCTSVHRVQEGQTTLLHELWGLVQSELAGR